MSNFKNREENFLLPKSPGGFSPAFRCFCSSSKKGGNSRKKGGKIPFFVSIMHVDYLTFHFLWRRWRNEGTNYTEMHCGRSRTRIVDIVGFSSWRWDDVFFYDLGDIHNCRPCSEMRLFLLAKFSDAQRKILIPSMLSFQRDSWGNLSTSFPFPP